VRKGSEVEGRHREQIEASGLAGQDIEFKPDGITTGEMEAMIGKAFLQRLDGIEPAPFVMNSKFDPFLDTAVRKLGIEVVWLDNSDIAPDGHFIDHE
jgi:hypothetical protein